jgi:hypothetical protein
MINSKRIVAIGDYVKEKSRKKNKTKKPNLGRLKKSINLALVFSYAFYSDTALCFLHHASLSYRASKSRILR